MNAATETSIEASPVEKLRKATLSLNATFREAHEYRMRLHRHKTATEAYVAKMEAEKHTLEEVLKKTQQDIEDKTMLKNMWKAKAEEWTLARGQPKAATAATVTPPRNNEHKPASNLTKNPTINKVIDNPYAAKPRKLIFDANEYEKASEHNAPATKPTNTDDESVQSMTGNVVQTNQSKKKTQEDLTNLFSFEKENETEDQLMLSYVNEIEKKAEVDEEKGGAHTKETAFASANPEDSTVAADATNTIQTRGAKRTRSKSRKVMENEESTSNKKLVTIKQEKTEDIMPTLV